MNLNEILYNKYGKDGSLCTNEEVYAALLCEVNRLAAEKKAPESKKKLYYVSAEFLIGKLLSNNLINLGLYDDVKNQLAEMGKNICEIEEIENEPSLGNGGLGRLAACFLDSIATLGLNGDGIGLNYHFGLFRQVFENNAQTTIPDRWLGKNSQVNRTDKVYSVKSHYHLILSRFTQLREKYRTTGKYLDGKVVSLMRVYITGETFHREPAAWSTQSITYNWHSPELWEWSNKNQGIVPNPGENIAEFICNEGYKLPKPFISNLSGKRISTFGDLVMYYKSLLHIKRDDNLQNKILYVYKKGYQTGDQNSHPWLDRVDLTIGEFDNNIELFTSVDKLLQAFGAILSICIKWNYITLYL